MERTDDDEVQALKREVELLKTLLHQEREKSSSSNGKSQHDVSPTRPASPAKPIPLDRPSFRPSSSTKPPSQTLDGDNGRGEGHSPQSHIALSSASQRSKSMRWNGGTSAAQSSAAALYLQHIPVDTKRGKWWLKSRQILSRNVPSPFDDCIAMKVRETWLWNGRAVVVDKIVTCPNTVDDSDELDACEGNEQDKEEKEEEELYDRQPSPEHGLSPAKDMASELYSDSKQLAQEFMLPKTSSTTAAGTDAKRTATETSEPLHAASARMEHQMSVAAAAAQEPSAADRQPLPAKSAPSPSKAPPLVAE